MKSIIKMTCALVWIVLGLFVVVSTSLAGPAPWGPMDQIEKAAKEEGQVVIYAASGHASRAAQRALSAGFEKRYGINIQWTSVSPQDIGTRVLAEQRSRRRVVDVLMHGVGGSFILIQKRGYLTPMLPPSTYEKDIWRVDPVSGSPTKRDWFFINMPLRPSFFINTRLVPPGEEPTSYQDLLKPKWKGKIVFQTPARGGSGSGWFKATYHTLGVDYLRKLAKQVVLVPSVSEVPDSVARGRFLLGLAATTTRGLQLVEEGAPVRFVQPKEGAHMATQGMDFIANAPHPNAGKLFINWFYTREGQMIYAPANHAISVRKDVPQDYMPEFMRYREGAPFMAADPSDMTAERTRELLKLGREIFEQGK